jgi:negative regulator of flagellin synthesis FlgM
MHVYGPSGVHGAQPIHGPHAPRPAEATAPSGSSSIGDQLDISEAGRIAAQLAEIPDIRSDRVAELRAAIASGTYETEARISQAVERLLDEIA